jgi:hypothetical protein
MDLKLHDDQGNVPWAVCLPEVGRIIRLAASKGTRRLSMATYQRR